MGASVFIGNACKLRVEWAGITDVWAADIYMAAGGKTNAQVDHSFKTHRKLPNFPNLSF